MSFLLNSLIAAMNQYSLRITADALSFQPSPLTLSDQSTLFWLRTMILDSEVLILIEVSCQLKLSQCELQVTYEQSQ